MDTHLRTRKHNRKPWSPKDKFSPIANGSSLGEFPRLTRAFQTRTNLNKGLRSFSTPRPRGRKAPNPPNRSAAMPEGIITSLEQDRRGRDERRLNPTYGRTGSAMSQYDGYNEALISLQ